MWTDTTRAHHSRKGLTLPSDLSDGEWAVLEPFFPPPSQTGWPRKWPVRRVVEGILYLLRGGLPWRMLPPCFPPVSTVQRWFYLWRDMGPWERINHYLLQDLRTAQGREASPTAGVIDSQSVKTTESGGPRGYDAGKKINGKKRHIITDTQGFTVGAVVHTADVQHRDGARCASQHPQQLPLAASCLRGRRLGWRQASHGADQYRQVDNRDYQAIRSRQGLRSSAPPLGRRAHLHMAGT